MLSIKTVLDEGSWTLQSTPLETLDDVNNVVGNVNVVEKVPTAVFEFNVEARLNVHGLKRLIDDWATSFEYLLFSPNKVPGFGPWRATRTMWAYRPLENFTSRVCVSPLALLGLGIVNVTVSRPFMLLLVFCRGKTNCIVSYCCNESMSYPFDVKSRRPETILSSWNVVLELEQSSHM